ncbi:MAG: winged helix DNA-binding protein [Bacteroidales bacterium]|nr:winged helix DNA-binding protein [Bacteroidales bacterium]
MKKLCIIRDICRSISDFEAEFHKINGMCLNEGMVLCSLKERRLSSVEIAKQINLTCSNTSKLIRSIEDKGFIERDLGEEDRRQMYFSLTEKGLKMLDEIESDKIELTGPLAKIGK